jgi:ElaB/YqjD/DUF883 family membrane-anchored ribosome-binding protein
MRRKIKLWLGVILSKNKELREVQSVEKDVKDLRKDMDRRLDDLRAQMNAISQRATKVVAERPLLALGVAFVAGMALGIALSKASD